MLEKLREQPARVAESRKRSAGFLTRVSVLVHAHRARLLAYARRHGLDAEEALDVVQDSFISFLELPKARSVAHESEDALRFLTVIVRHNVQNQRRKRSRRSRVHSALGVETIAGDMQSSEALIAHAEELSRVSGCLSRMARLEREVVMLSLLDQQPRDQVAEVLGISSGYLRVLLHRARQHLRTCSFQYGQEPAVRDSFGRELVTDL
ncbi:MAG TPA: sigma-70 family RNA polymerase sigma factor [Polyangiaceae bacterium]|nr:sigma-70 family RNA polymerase sigma factor [Polyangiaceae bacterium]